MRLKDIFSLLQVLRMAFIKHFEEKAHAITKAKTKHSLRGSLRSVVKYQSNRVGKPFLFVFSENKDRRMETLQTIMVILKNRHR